MRLYSQIKEKSKPNNRMFGFSLAGINEDAVNTAYHDYFPNTSINNAGYTYWVNWLNGGGDINTMRGIFAVYARVNASYLGLLNRLPTEAEAKYWADYILSGNSASAMNTKISQTDEFIRLHSTEYQTQFVNAIVKAYNDFIYRQPTETEINDWLSFMNFGRTHTINEMRNLVRNLPESPNSDINIYNKRIYDLFGVNTITDNVKSVLIAYRQIYNKEPDNNNAVMWLSFLDKGYSAKNMITVLEVYKLAFNKEPVDVYAESWLSYLSEGHTKQDMLDFLVVNDVWTERLAPSGTKKENIIIIPEEPVAQGSGEPSAEPGINPILAIIIGSAVAVFTT